MASEEIVVCEAGPSSNEADLASPITDGSTDKTDQAETSFGTEEFMCPFCSAKFTTEEEEDAHIASCESADTD